MDMIHPRPDLAFPTNALSKKSTPLQTAITNYVCMYGPLKVTSQSPTPRPGPPPLRNPNRLKRRPVPRRSTNSSPIQGRIARRALLHLPRSTIRPRQGRLPVPAGQAHGRSRGDTTTAKLFFLVVLFVGG